MKWGGQSVDHPPPCWAARKTKNPITDIILRNGAHRAPVRRRSPVGEWVGAPLPIAEVEAQRPSHSLSLSATPGPACNFDSTLGISGIDILRRAVEGGQFVDGRQRS